MRKLTAEDVSKAVSPTTTGLGSWDGAAVYLNNLLSEPEEPEQWWNWDKQGLSAALNMAGGTEVAKLKDSLGEIYFRASDGGYCESAIPDLTKRGYWVVDKSLQNKPEGLHDDTLLAIVDNDGSTLNQLYPAICVDWLDTSAFTILEPYTGEE